MVRSEELTKIAKVLKIDYEDAEELIAIIRRIANQEIDHHIDTCGGSGEGEV